MARDKVGNMPLLNQIKSMLEELWNHRIVEQGTSDNWTYKKYADGTMEAWKTLNDSIKANILYSGTICYCVYGGQALPNGFISAPAITITGCFPSGLWWFFANQVTASSFGLVVISAANMPATSGSLYYRAIGKWK